MGLVLARIEENPYASVTLITCFFHSIQRIVLAVITVLNDFEWPSLAQKERLTTTYWNLLSAFGHVWRSTGVHRLVGEQARDLNLTPEVQLLFNKSPKKPIKGR